MALLIAVTVLLAVTPLGYIPVNPLLTLVIIQIPAIIAGITLGPEGGYGVGLAFGITSFLRAPIESAFTIAIFQDNIFWTFIICVAPRLFIGLVAAGVFRLLKKLPKTLAYGIAGAAGSLANTLFFLGALFLVYSFRDISNSALGAFLSEIGTTINAVIIGTATTNGLIEAAVCFVAVAAICKGLEAAKLIKWKKRYSNYLK